MQNTRTDSNGSTFSTECIRDLLADRKRERRWKNIRFFAGLALVLVLVGGYLFQGGASMTGDASSGYVSLVRLNGMIAPGQDFSAENVLPVLEEAFADKKSAGVILDINSGGGTPVQAAIIHDAILDYKNRYHKKVVAVGEDMLASGAYYVAVASDKIWINPNSITGSIGVIMKDFGFPDLIKKIGVERRVYTSGANKDRLDPFLPQTPEDIQKIQGVISEIHGNFRSVVEAGRKGKLNGNPDAIFSGDFWSGQTAVKLGLADMTGNLSDAMKQEFQVSAYKDYSAQPSFVKSIMGQLGSTLASLPLSASKVEVLEKL